MYTSHTDFHVKSSLKAEVYWICHHTPVRGKSIADFGALLHRWPQHTVVLIKGLTLWILGSIREGRSYLRFITWSSWFPRLTCTSFGWQSMKANSMTAISTEWGPLSTKSPLKMYGLSTAGRRFWNRCESIPHKVHAWSVYPFPDNPLRLKGKLRPTFKYRAHWQQWCIVRLVRANGLLSPRRWRTDTFLWRTITQMNTCISDGLFTCINSMYGNKNWMNFPFNTTTWGGIVHSIMVPCHRPARSVARHHFGELITSHQSAKRMLETRGM